MQVKSGRKYSDMLNLLLENERVKVYELNIKSGEKTEMHSHPEYVLYPLTDSKLSIEYADGKSEQREFKCGDAGYRPAQKHTVENIGTKDARIVIVELKKK